MHLFTSHFPFSNLLRQEATQLYSKYLNIFYWHQVCPGPVLKSYHPATLRRIPSPAHLNQKAVFSYHQSFSFISRSGLGHHWFTSKTHTYVLQITFSSYHSYLCRPFPTFSSSLGSVGSSGIPFWRKTQFYSVDTSVCILSDGDMFAACTGICSIFFKTIVGLSQSWRQFLHIRATYF